MTTSAHSPTASSDRALLAVLFVSVSIAATYVAILAAGGRVLPDPLNELIFVALATTVVAILIRQARDQIIRHLDQSYARRAEPVYASEITRDLSRARVVASVPVAVGLDSGVVEIGARIARRLNEGSDR